MYVMLAQNTLILPHRMENECENLSVAAVFKIENLKFPKEIPIYPLYSYSVLYNIT